jgi:CheY-like chemotaxis protein
MTGLLLETQLTGEQSNFAELIRSSSETLLTLINNILDFSKIESGKLVLEVAPFDLVACIEETLDLFAARAGQKGLALSYLLTPQTPTTIVGDSGRLRQILTNLVGNAVKFTSQGAVRVTVDSQAGDNHHLLHFAVHDTGIGISEEGIARLFHSFSQVDSSTTRRYEGTGLGLAISRHLSQLLGGEMWLESELGVGSVFHFTLQAQAATTQLSAPQPVAPTRVYDPSLAQRLPLRILVAEDNLVNQKVALHMLARLGYRADVAANGMEVLLAVERQPYDVVLMDVQMPEMDGLEATRQLCAQWPPEERPYIIAMTAHAMAGDDEKCIAAGMDDYISKPVQVEKLVAALHRCQTSGIPG